MKKGPIIFIIIVVFLLFSSNVAYAQTCETSIVKSALKKALFEYFKDPSLSPLEVTKIRDLLTFYLNIAEGEINVNCNVQGGETGIVMDEIVSEARAIVAIIPTCSDGTEYGECSASKPRYCYDGNLLNRCGICGCDNNDTCNNNGECIIIEEPPTEPPVNDTPNITCSLDSDCGVSGFTSSNYCKETSLNWSEVVRDHINFTCLNPRIISSSCSSIITSPSIEDCTAQGKTCSSGACQAVNQTVNVTCVDYDSGDNIFDASYVEKGSTFQKDRCTPELINSEIQEQTCLDDVITSIDHDCPVGFTCQNTYEAAIDTYVSSCISDNVTTEIIRITTDTTSQGDPDIYGDIIVWEDLRSNYLDIFMYDISTGQETRLTNSSASQENPAIYGNKIVWEDFRNDNMDIYMYDISTGKETQITTNTANQFEPDIYGDKIVWRDFRNSNEDIYMYDLSTNQETQITTNTANQYDPVIYGDKIMWSDQRNSNFDLYMYDLSTGQETVVRSLANIFGLNPAIYNNQIVWRDDRNGNAEVYMYDLSTGQETRITSNSATQGTPKIYGNKIVWIDYRDNNFDIYMYDLSTGQEMPIVTDLANQWTPDIYGDKIVWTDSRNGNNDIYMTTIP